MLTPILRLINEILTSVNVFRFTKFDSHILYSHPVLYENYFLYWIKLQMDVE
jgi:hypothetical protein